MVDLSLPKDEFQCVHVDGYSGQRCTEDAICEEERHGWLCEKHLDVQVKLTSHTSHKDLDDQAIQFLIEQEKKAIQSGVVSEWKLNHKPLGLRFWNASRS